MENKDWINDYMSLKQVNSNNPFTVPDGYFDNLSDRIEAYKNITELTGNSAGNGFTVPAGYFDELTGNIQSRIAIEEALSADTGFTIPEGYFDNLTQQIQSRVFVEEALAGSDENFSVPAGYFDKLNAAILDKTVKADEAKQGGVIRRLVSTTAFKYATAACFALVLGGGILLNELSSNVTEHDKTFLHKQLSVVPVDEIQSYLQLNDDASDVQQSVVSEGAKVDDKQLNDALQKDIDSVQ
jgi:hypothetical protein